MLFLSDIRDQSYSVRLFQSAHNPFPNDRFGFRAKWRKELFISMFDDVGVVVVSREYSPLILDNLKR